MKKVGRPELRPRRLKTLEELEGFVAGAPPFDSNLVRRLYALRKKPIGEFTNEDLRVTIGQGLGIAFLLPLALERLEAKPLAEGSIYRGDLLMNVLYAEPHWGRNAEHRARVREIVRRALEQLATIVPFDWESDHLPAPNEPDDIDRESLEPRLRNALVMLSEAAG